MPEGGERPPIWERSLKIKIIDLFSELGIVDEFLQKRAVDLIEKSKISEHLKPGGVYLDIGTGLGHVVERIVKDEGKDIKFMAIEPQRIPLRKVRRRVQKEAEGKALFGRAVGESLPIKDKSLDGVSLFFVTPYVNPEAREQIFQEIDRVLKDDGMLFLVEDTPASEEEEERNSKWDRRLNFESKEEKHYYFSDEEWRRYLDEKGFELIDYAYFEDVSSKKDEGLIRHGSYILKRKQKPQV